MENASKALLIGAGILIAVLTISLVINVFSSASQNYKTQEEVETVEQIAAFNKEYASYNRKLLRGTDIISLCNKAISNNKKYEDIAERQIEIEFQMVEEVVYINSENKGVGTDKTFEILTRYNMNDISNIKSDPEAFTDFKRRIFNCEELVYNENTGRIESMFFREQKIDYTEGI